MLRRLFCLPCLLALLGPAHAQGAQYWTERRNLGFEGPVKSALTTVERPNPDPRPQGRTKLLEQANPDWAAFDTQGRRTEFASASNRDHFEVISTCTFHADGTKVCKDSMGRTQEAREEKTTQPDGSRQVTYLLSSEVESRVVTRFDEKGAVSSGTYDKNGRLMSEDSTMPNGDEESKIYDQAGRIVLNQKTRESEDKTRVDRWSYDSEDLLIWHLAVDSHGELLSYWYKIGYQPALSSSDSLGVCGGHLCVSYKFDGEGTGRMEKIVQHTSGEGNLEPDREEHYNFNGVLDEKVEIKYARDTHGNWTTRTVFVWDATSNLMTKVESDTRTIEYY